MNKFLTTLLCTVGLSVNAQFLTDQYTATTNEVNDGLNQTKPVTPWGLANSKWVNSTNSGGGTPGAVTNGQVSVFFGSPFYVTNSGATTTLQFPTKFAGLGTTNIIESLFNGGFSFLDFQGNPQNITAKSGSFSGLSSFSSGLSSDFIQGVTDSVEWAMYSDGVGDLVLGDAGGIYAGVGLTLAQSTGIATLRASGIMLTGGPVTVSQSLNVASGFFLTGNLGGSSNLPPVGISTNGSTSGAVLTSRNGITMYTNDASGLTNLQGSKIVGTIPLSVLPSGTLTNNYSGVITSTNNNIVNALFQGFLNNDLEFVIQNTSTGTNASSSFYAVADNGSSGATGTNNTQMGINNSGYLQTTTYFGGPDDGYMFTTGSNLWVGSYRTNTAIVLSTGNGGSLTNVFVNTNGEALLIGKYYGNGAGLTNLPWLPVYPFDMGGVKVPSAASFYPLTGNNTAGGTSLAMGTYVGPGVYGFGPISTFTSVSAAGTNLVLTFGTNTTSFMSISLPISIAGAYSGDTTNFWVTNTFTVTGTNTFVWLSFTNSPFNSSVNYNVRYSLLKLQ